MTRTIALALLAACGIGQSADFAQQADQYIQSRAKDGHFMGAVLVARDGKVLFEKAS